MKRVFASFFIFTVLLSATLFSAENDELKNKLIAEAKADSGEIEPQKLREMLIEGENVVVLDIREIEQRAEGNIYIDESTIITQYAMTRGVLEFHIMGMITDKDATVVAFCRSGDMGVFAAQTLKRLGYKNATSLKGGLKGWVKEGYYIKTGLGVTKVVSDVF